MAAEGRVIGITGGVGAGKSRILSILENEYGARLILADQVAKELEEPGQEGLLRLTERFGKEILDATGRLDKAAFAERIFQDPEALEAVNAIIHPMTWQEIRRRIGIIRAEGDPAFPPFIVVEAALFDETSKNYCDTLWYVDTSEENRIRRLGEMRGYSREKCRDIMKNQPSREDFLALADVVIDNNGSLDETRGQIVRILGTSAREGGDNPGDFYE